MFHTNFKTMRLKSGLSQKQVADYLNISPQSISKWEKGAALPSIEFLPKLAKCLSCEINDFFAEDEDSVFEYSCLYQFFALEVEVIYNGQGNQDRLMDFIKDNPDSFEIATKLCDAIKEYKMLKRKNIQGILNCSEQEANDFMILLERHEFIVSIENDSYVVAKDAVEGFKTLMRLQKELYRFY